MGKCLGAHSQTRDVLGTSSRVISPTGDVIPVQGCPSHLSPGSRRGLGVHPRVQGPVRYSLTNTHKYRGPQLQVLGALCMFRRGPVGLGTLDYAHRWGVPK